MLIFILLLLVNVQASDIECRRMLLDDFKDSFRHVIRANQAPHSNELKSKAKEALVGLHNKFGCDVSSIKTIQCLNVVPQNYLSEVCYTESVYGYYIINQDLLDNISLTVHRWD